MKRLLIPALCMVLAGCIQTTSGTSPAPVADAGSHEPARSPTTAERTLNDADRPAACAEAATGTASAGSGATILSGALGLVGGVAGFGGRGSAMAGAAASAAGGGLTTVARTNALPGTAGQECQQ